MDVANEKFKEFLLGDLLINARMLSVKKMFGSYGLYYNAKMCGIIHKEKLFLKTNETIRQKYTSSECKPFTYTKTDAKTGKETTATLKNYIAIPSRLLDDADELLAWIRESASA